MPDGFLYDRPRTEELPDPGADAKSVIEMLPKALLYEELPGASVETCGAYREHDLNGARSEIQRLVNADIVALENPPLLQKIR